MKTADKKSFEDLTNRLLTEHAGFAYAVSRIVTPVETSERAVEDAERARHEIDSRRKQNPIEAFCSPT
jgi:hypothetical protein